MRRRDALGVAGAGLLAGTAGCTQRVTGWSGLTLAVGNRTDDRHLVGVVVSVDGETVVEDTFELAGPGSARRALPTVPWDATMTCRASLADGGPTDRREWDATVPLWGGNACMIEPYVEVSATSPAGEEGPAVTVWQRCTG